MTAASGLAGGAMGLLVALWRDRTYQSLSLTLLMVILSVVAVIIAPGDAVTGRPRRLGSAILSLRVDRTRRGVIGTACRRPVTGRGIGHRCSPPRSTGRALPQTR